MDRFVIIVAGGKGLRMGGDVPKQFQLVGGRPVLVRTLEAFHQWDASAHIVLVLPESQIDFWKSICEKHCVKVPHEVCCGGETRYHSVKNGLKIISANGGIIGVHDGVRPFVSPSVIENLYKMAETEKAVVPVIPVVETVRQILPDDNSQTVDRSAYRLVQTPQVFDLQLLRDAYSIPFVPEFTDDASVVEAYGGKIVLAEGNRENIKLTTPFDLCVAEALVKGENA